VAAAAAADRQVAKVVTPAARLVEVVVRWLVLVVLPRVRRGAAPVE
jgi:hypothetical protein